MTNKTKSSITNNNSLLTLATFLCFTNFIMLHQSTQAGGSSSLKGSTPSPAGDELMLMNYWTLPDTDLFDDDNDHHSTSVCKGTVAECGIEDDDDDEFDIDAEDSDRRILRRRRRYISYGALRRNNVPCSRRGRSYYNCRSRGRANPYRRGCSRISRCRR